MEATRQALMPMRRHRPSGRMSLTPLIDVVFILLIFFMLQTNFLRPRSIEFAHAVGSSNAASDATVISVELHANGSIWLNGVESSLDGLHSYAARLTQVDNTRIVLGLDPKVPLQRAVDVMDLFHRFGLDNISLSAARTFD